MYKYIYMYTINPTCCSQDTFYTHFVHCHSEGYECCQGEKVKSQVKGPGKIGQYESLY